MKTLETILKEHGVISYDIRTNAAVTEYINQFPVFHPTPTEAEINEAAENLKNKMANKMAGVFRNGIDIGFKSAITWLQNYQKLALGITDTSPIVEDNTNNSTIRENRIVESDYQTQGREKKKRSTIGITGVELAARENINFDGSELDIEYVAGANFGSRWQASQPNTAIAVIEAKIKELESLMSKINDCPITLAVVAAQINILETILKQIKP